MSYPRSPTVVGLGLAACLAAPFQAQKPEPPKALVTAGLAGQGVALLPVTMVVTDPRLPSGAGLGSRAVLLSWADSLIGEAFQERAPEVQWVLPPELRRLARRSPGLVRDPDRMGQAIMRSNYKEVPDPLRSHLRQLMAVAGGRFAFIPAAVYLGPAGAESLMVELGAVLADARTGRVVWRSRAVGQGETASHALRAALATILPVESSIP